MKTSIFFQADESQMIALQDIPDSVTVIIQEQIARLRLECKSIADCLVNIQVPPHLPEGFYHIQISIKLPNRVLTIERKPVADYYQEDIYVAIWSAFDLAKQELKEYLMRSGDSKTNYPNQHNLHQNIRPIRRCRGYAGA